MHALVVFTYLSEMEYEMEYDNLEPERLFRAATA
jgi:hypothetical protein